MPDAIPTSEREAIDSSDATVQLWKSGHNQLSYWGLKTKNLCFSLPHADIES